MKRLRDQVSSPDPVVAHAAALVAAVRPLDPSQIRRRPLPGEARARPVNLHLRLAFVLALILASAVAGAATRPGARWLRSVASWARPSGPSSPAPRVLAQRARESVADNASHSPAPPSADVLPVVPAATTSPAPAPLPVGAAPRSVRAAAATADESALVVDAVRALRRDHDARRAGELAEEVLQRYPRGMQREEAMDVAMEAAIAYGDAAAARRWAERYLESFGAGRFADRARDVLAAPPR
jgi:hypothetical protein